MNKNKGFTLIEILIALAIFAILATLTTSILYNAFTTRARVNKQSERLNNLEIAISLMQQDTQQIVDRAIRGNDMRLYPAFIGQVNYLEFTRDGVVNPKSIEKRSTLKRIAYVCEKGSLLRRTWDTLDSINRNNYQEKRLLDHLTQCYFGYLNQSLQVLPEWREQSVDLRQPQNILPKAIQLNMTLSKHGKINLLFPLSESLYDAN